MSTETQPTLDQRLRDYLQTPPPRVGSTLRRGPAAISRLTPQRLRLPIRRTVTQALAVRSRPRLARLVAERRAQGAPVLLHLGSGSEHKAGYVNIDLAGADVDVALDLARGLPLPDGSVDGVFHEHFLEHLPTRVGYAFLQECVRVLAPGGVLRVGVPDAGRCIDSYAGKADPDWANSSPTPLMAVERLFYEHSHLAMYDVVKLSAMFRVVGLVDVTRKAYRETALDPVPDTERRRHSLYVEGRHRTQ